MVHNRTFHEVCSRVYLSEAGALFLSRTGCGLNRLHLKLRNQNRVRLESTAPETSKPSKCWSYARVEPLAGATRKQRHERAALFTKPERYPRSSRGCSLAAQTVVMIDARDRVRSLLVRTVNSLTTQVNHEAGAWAASCPNPAQPACPTAPVDQCSQRKSSANISHNMYPPRHHGVDQRSAVSHLTLAPAAS